MLTKRDRTAAYKVIEELYRRRADNIAALLEPAGPFVSWVQLAKASGFNMQMLVMMAGPGRTRMITEFQARRFEIALGLPVNWLDQKH